MSNLIKNMSKDSDNWATTNKNIVKNKKLPIDPNYDNLVERCNNFVSHKIKLLASFSFDDKQTQVSNCNAVGDILESIFYPRFKQIMPSMKVGPKQSSPDFWTERKKFEYEMKTYTIKPSFDIANFSSYISQLTEDHGVFRKLFRTKYIVFEYEIKDEIIVIKSFHVLNVWQIVGYSGKYPITLQNKRRMWYNIRPSSANDWNDKEKTPDKFIASIIQAIKECPNNIKKKDDIISNIQKQYAKIKLKYEF